MNFTKILSQMHQLGIKEQQLRRKFARKHQIENKYHPSLKGSEEDEDLAIYGYTNHDIVKYFRKKHTTHEAPNKYQRQNASSLKKYRKFPQRSKTAKSTPKQRKQDFKNVNLSADKPSYNSTPNQRSFCEHSANSPTNSNINMFRAKNNSNSNMQMRKKSIKRFKKSFKNNFQSNIIVAQNIRKKQSKTITLKMVKFQPSRYSLQNKENSQNFFTLTQEEYTEARPSFSDIGETLNLVQNRKFLQKLPIMIFDDTCDQYSQKIVQNRKRVQSIFEGNHREYNKRLGCYIVELKTLKTIYLSGMEIEFLTKVLMKKQSQKKNIYLCIIQKNQNENKDRQKIKYQEFMIGGKISSRKSAQIFSQIIQFCFTLFLLLGNNAHSIKSAITTSTMFFSKLHKLPKGFDSFIETVSNKHFLVRTNQHEINSFEIKQIYSSCLRGFSESENRLFEKVSIWHKNDSKNKQQYFYICFVVFYQRLYFNYNGSWTVPSKIKFLSSKTN